MKRNLLAFVAMPLIGALSGCGGVYVVDSIFDSSAPSTSCNGIMVPNERTINPQCAAYKTAFLEAQTDVGKRNFLLTQILTTTDEVCKKHKGDIRATATNMNLTFGTLTTLFAGTASLTAGTAAKTYAAAATASNASRSLVNEEVYRREMADAVLKAIEAQRDPKRRAIEEGLKTTTTTAYPIERGIQDLITFHDMCSFVNGMAYVTQSIDSRKETSTTLRAKVAQLRVEYDKNEKAIETMVAGATKTSLQTENAALLTEIVRLSTRMSSSAE